MPDDVLLLAGGTWRASRSVAEYREEPHPARRRENTRLRWICLLGAGVLWLLLNAVSGAVKRLLGLRSRPRCGSLRRTPSGQPGQLKQVSPATAPRGPQRAEAPAGFRIPASTVQLRHLRPAAIGHLHPDKTVPRADRDRDRPARSARPAAGHHCRTARSPAGRRHPARVPGTKHLADERAGNPRPLRPPPGHRHALPDLRPSHQRTRLPPPPHSRQITGAGRPYLRKYARLSGSRQAGTRDRRGPSVAVRGKPTVRTDRPRGRTPSAYLHRHVTASGFRDGPFSVSGRASLCSLALIAACSCERAARVRGREAPAQRRRRRP
jgi:hypothetical protein